MNKYRRTRGSINEKIVFVDSEEIEVTLVTLLIRVDAVLSILSSIGAFQQIAGQTIGTNGELIFLREMSSPAFELEEMLIEKFIPLGLQPDRDFVFLEEQLIYGAGDRITPLLNKPIPGSEQIEWLASEVRLNGNFVKFKQVCKQGN
jgi:hypothetical protein